MTGDPMNRTISVSELGERLDALRNEGPAAVAFDADGTLWSGDVGEDVFEAVVGRNEIREEARPAIEALLRRHGIVRRGDTPSAAAGAALDAFRAGRLSHLDACELMTWGYAGFMVSDLAQTARQVLDEKRLSDRLHPELEPIIAWARSRSVRMIIVSASPRIIVEIAGARFGFAPADIVAADPVIRNARIEGAMERPLPFGPTKRRAAEALLGNARLLAGFGDSDYDLDMMQAAALAVAVRPKPSLLRALATAPNVLVLRR